MDSFSEALALLPKQYASLLNQNRRFDPEELRLRLGRPPSMVIQGAEHPLALPPVREEELSAVLEKATGASLYRAAEALRQGYFCTDSLRLGVCGNVTAQNGGTGFTSYSSLCIRLAHDCRGICSRAAEELFADGLENTLILSPPGGGKTTALRDLIRNLSCRGVRIGVIDERGELSNRVFDLGPCTDVITGSDKLSGALLLLRSMAPQIIAMDEISAPADIEAVQKIFGCGTGLIATAHAKGIEDLSRREIYRELLRHNVFRRVLTIRREGSERLYELESLAS